MVADRDQQVGLAEADAAVDEQRVVRGRRRRLGDGHRGRVREPVARARARTRRTCSWGTASPGRRAGGQPAPVAPTSPSRQDGGRPIRGRAVGRARRTRARQTALAQRLVDDEVDLDGRPDRPRRRAARSSARWLCCRRSRTSGLGTARVRTSSSSVHGATSANHMTTVVSGSSARARSRTCAHASRRLAVQGRRYRHALSTAPFHTGG